MARLWRRLVTLAPALTIILSGCSGGGEGNQNNNQSALCGNGMIDGDEACDEGPQNSDTKPDRCRKDCRLPRCGDSVVDPQGGEVCDCGDGSGALPAGCAGPNSDLLGSTCSTRCRVPVCGDGVVEAGETCDGTNLGGETCQSLGFAAGSLSCFNCELWRLDCLDGCGNSRREGEEACDGADLGGVTCADLGFGWGELACLPACAFDLTGCWEGCGNGRRESGEQCDGADLGSQSCAWQGFAGGTLACRGDCTWDFTGCLGGCGNGILETGESCDDANVTPWDGCNACAIVEFRVSTCDHCDDCEYCSADSPSVAMASDGRMVVAWSEGYAGDSRIRARQYPATGAPAGAELLVSESQTYSGTQPAVAMAGDGRFVVTWTSSAGQDGSGRGIFARRYAADGSAQGPEFGVNTETSGDQSDPAVAMGSDGRFVVVWQSYGQDGSAEGIYAQRFDGAGSPEGMELQVNTLTASAQRHPAVSMAGDGRFVVVWHSDHWEAGGHGIFAQRYAATGAAEGGELQVSADEDVRSPAVAMGSDGRFVVVWTHGSLDGHGSGVISRRYDQTGSPLSSETVVNTHTTYDQDEPAVAMAPDGRFVVLWQSYYQDTSELGVYGQRFAADGQAQGDEFGVNVYTARDQRSPAVAMGSDGRFAVVWQSYGQVTTWTHDIFGQRFAADGTARGMQP